MANRARPRHEEVGVWRASAFVTTIRVVKRADVRVDGVEVTLAWGKAAEAKAVLRTESEERFRALPLSERLLIALSMVRSVEADERRNP